MKLRNIIFTTAVIMVLVLLILSVVLVLPATSKNPKEKMDINNEMPPDIEPQMSTWYKIQPREIINQSVESVMGLSRIDENKNITIIQAASAIYYIYGQLYKDHGYIENFIDDIQSRAHTAVDSLSMMEGHDVNPYSFVSLEQFCYLLSLCDTYELEGSAMDPATGYKNAINVDMLHDYNLVNPYYRKALANMVNKGYLYGDGNLNIAPKRNITLKDFSAIMERVIHLQISSHPILISCMQLKSLWSEFNCLTLRIPSFLISNIIEIILSGTFLGIPIGIPLYKRHVKKSKK